MHRIALAIYERQAPEAPWITREACAYLEAWLKPEHVAVEWGSGRSTLWFAERVGRLISVEHDANWHERVAAELRQRGLKNVEYHLATLPQCGTEGDDCYVERALKNVDVVDFALVDGQFRDLCTQMAMRRLRPGGLLVIDNAEQFFSHASHSPSALQRTGAALSPLWLELRTQLAGWPCVWTSNGVFDTALFTKPAPE
jgi:predicted O-methyltransferase YrrM